tara:strand:+ start:131 stop:691 length:561 start_codon:yes stop_codon:yes gene_type:complete
LNSISEAGDFIYDSVNFWDDDEPEQSEAVIIEEAVEVPEYAIPDESYFEPGLSQEQNFRNQQSFQPQANVQPYYDPIYRSQRQYYYVGPNGTPMLAPPPPPFPQYSIDQVAPLPYSYSNNLDIPRTSNPNINNFAPRQNLGVTNQNQNVKPTITLEEEMEIFGIQNDCVRVKEDFVNGGFMCDDYD